MPEVNTQPLLLGKAAAKWLLEVMYPESQVSSTYLHELSMFSDRGVGEEYPHSAHQPTLDDEFIVGIRDIGGHREKAGDIGGILGHWGTWEEHQETLVMSTYTGYIQKVSP